MPNNKADLIEDPEISKLLEQVNEERKKYEEWKHIISLISACAKDPRLNPILRKKIKRNITIFTSANFCLSLPNSGISNTQSGNLNMLGITTLTPSKLTVVEQKSLQYAFTEKVMERHSSKKDHTDPASHSTEELLALYQQLIDLMHSHASLLESNANVVEQLMRMRTVQLPQTCSAKMQECEAERETFDQKMRILHDQLQLDIINESGGVLDRSGEGVRAFDMLLDDIQKQQQTLVKEIAALRTLKGQYDRVASREYDQILEQYVRQQDLMTEFEGLLETK